MIEDLFDCLKRNILKAVSDKELDDLIELSRVFGVDVEQLSKDLAGLVKERLLMQLIGNVPMHLNFGERQHFVARRLRMLSGNTPHYQPNANLPEVLTLTEIQQAVASALSESRDGVGNLDERLALDIMQAQGYRCAVCGIPLRASVRKKSSRFADGLEPIAERFHLDHVVPYYFFGNEGGRRILCISCNSVKNDRIGVQEDGFVISGNHIRSRDGQAIRRRMMFWTLEHIKRCEYTPCNADTTNSILLVQARRPDVPFMYGNLEVRCDCHAIEQSVWIHS